jgi:transposase InsO family protein
MPTFFISAQGLPIAVQARLSGRSRSSLYYKLKQPKKDEHLLNQIIPIHDAHPFFGYKSIAKLLGANHKRVYRVMRRSGLRAKTSRRIRSKNQYNSGKSSLPNMIKETTISSPNHVWAGDFTHFTFKRRTFYLATVMDLYTRQIVGWHVSSSHSVDLVLEALNMAIGNRSHPPMLFHSDHGSEYLSETYLATLKDHDITPSNSAKGKPWQNGHVESWNYRFKEELEDPNRFKVFEKLFEHLCSQIHFYNNERIHSALKMAPDAFYAKKMKELEEAERIPKAA